MVKIINNSDKKIELTKELILSPKSYITANIEITPRLSHLINMGIIKIVSVENNVNKNVQEIIQTRHEKIMKQILNGETKPSRPLDNYAIPDIKKITNKAKNKKSKNK